MKNQALFSSKDKSEKIKMSSAAILFGPLGVNYYKVSLYMYSLSNEINVCCSIQ